MEFPLSSYFYLLIYLLDPVLCYGGCNGEIDRTIQNIDYFNNLGHDHLSATLKKQYFVTPRSGNNSGRINELSTVK